MMILQIRMLRLSRDLFRVVELGEELRDELEIFFGDGESIMKDQKADDLLQLLNVKISEL